MEYKWNLISEWHRNKDGRVNSKLLERRSQQQASPPAPQWWGACLVQGERTAAVVPVSVAVLCVAVPPGSGKHIRKVLSPCWFLEYKTSNSNTAVAINWWNQLNKQHYLLNTDLAKTRRWGSVENRGNKKKTGFSSCSVCRTFSSASVFFYTALNNCCPSNSEQPPAWPRSLTSLSYYS